MKSPLKLSSYEQSALAELSDRFRDIKWDNLYDKLHRTGENS